MANERLAFDEQNLTALQRTALIDGNAQSHTVQAGETLGAISRLYYRYSDEWPTIYFANPQLWQNISDADFIKQAFQDAEFKVYAGQKIVIPGRWQTRRYPEEQLQDEINLFIGGQKMPAPSSFSLTRFYDTVVDTFEAVYPFDPEIPWYRDTFRAESLMPVSVFFKNQRQFSGFAEQHGMKMSESEVSVTVGGRSRGYILQKSDIYGSRNYSGMDLISIAQKIAAPLGQRILVFPKEYTGTQSQQGQYFNINPFARCEAKPGDNAFDFLANLAKQRGILLRTNDEGDIVLFEYPLKKPDPVATLDINAGTLGTLGIPSLEVKYDTDKTFGSYVMHGTNQWGVRIEAAYRNARLVEPSIKIESANESEESDIQKTARVTATRSTREFFDSSIEMPSWTIPGTNIYWKPGQIVLLTAPALQIYKPHRMLVRVTEFRATPEKMSCNLRLVPEEAFSNEELKTPPWSLDAEKDAGLRK